jgi:hypothetical protein
MKIINLALNVKRNFVKLLDQPSGNLAATDSMSSGIIGIM